MLKLKPIASEMIYDNTSATSTRRDKSIGSTSGRGFESKSGLPTALQNTSVGNLPLEIDTDPLLQDILFSSDVASRQIVMRLYRDIYYNDAIGGSAVDLYSTLPFSEFNLGGITNDKVLDPYMETIERLNIRTLLNEISVDYLVTGTFIGSLLFNKTKSVFTDIMTHRSEDTDVIGLPFYGQDPIITANVPSELRSWINSGSNRAKKLQELLGPDLLKTLSQERIELDPISTIFIPRKTFSTNQLGTSYYRRILPIYLVEKNLFRGTLVESSRRQRGILHLTLGDGDQWEPTLEDMEAATDLFSNADADPLGAIIATRTGVSTEELRCLTGDTLIHTKEGLRRIDSLVEHDVNLNKPFTKRIDKKVRGYTGKYVTAEFWHYRGKKRVYTTTTESGTTIRTTENHKFLTINKDGSLTMEPICKIVSDDRYIVTNTKSSKKGESLKLNIQNFGIGYKSLNKISQMTPELAYVLGLIVSEGYINKNGVYVGNTDRQILKKYDACFTKVFGLAIKHEFSIEKGKTIIHGEEYATKEYYTSKCNSREVVNILTQLGVKYVEKHIRGDILPSHIQEIPWSILQADRQSKLAFFAAYIDGDGSICDQGNESHDTVELKINSSSLVLLQQFKIMLADMGYRSKLTGRRVTIPTSSSSALYNECIKYIAAARKHVYEVCTKPKEQRCGIPASAFIHLLNSRKVSSGPQGVVFTNDTGDYVTCKGYGELFRHFTHANSLLSYENLDAGLYDTHLRMIKRISKRLYKNLLRLIDCRYKYEKITKFVRGKEEHVYDISIKETQKPAFLANNIVVKNSGGELWKITDLWDQTSQVKLRALGISESFLSGDANYSSADTSLTVFMESLRAYRDIITRKLFYNKLFPLISLANGYTVNVKGKIVQREGLLDSDSEDVLRRMQDGSKLLIPTVHWAKQLKPEGDTAYFEMLSQLSEKGVPVPLRALAAAGGFNLDQLIQQQPDDFKLQKKIYAYQKALTELKKEFGPKVEEGEESTSASLSDNAMKKLLSPTLIEGSRSSVIGKTGRRGLFDRDFGDEGEITSTTRTGKKKAIYNQKTYQERANVKIMKALKTLAKDRNPLTTSTMTPILSGKNNKL